MPDAYAEIERQLQADPEARPFWQVFQAMKGFPERRRLELFRIFMSARQETLEMLRRKPTASTQPLVYTFNTEKFGGRAYDDDGQPTPEYLNHWKAFYGDPLVDKARQEARRRLAAQNHNDDA